MKVWVTKYALIDGVRTYEGVALDNGRIRCDRPYGRALYCFHCDEGKEWHRSEEDAIKRAEAMRKAKIANLKKELKKFEAMRFCKKEGGTNADI